MDEVEDEVNSILHEFFPDGLGLSPTYAVLQAGGDNLLFGELDVLEEDMLGC